jgi:hypothetical protein
VAALERLLELLRVAEEDEGASGRRDRDGVGQGELAGLVDAQHIHALGHLRA